KAKPVPCIEIFIKQVLAFMVPKSEIRIVRIFGSGQAFKRCNCFRPREVKKSPNEPAGEKCGRISRRCGRASTASAHVFE
ncbi:MAG TPA: hypothetical protein VF243_07685, partial [Nitrosospira sp.]